MPLTAAGLASRGCAITEKATVQHRRRPSAVPAGDGLARASSGRPYTGAEVRRIEELRRRGWCLKTIGDHLGRSAGSISCASNRHSRLDGRRLYLERVRKVTDLQVAQAKRLIISGKGMSAKRAAEVMGVSFDALRRLLRRQGWDPVAKRIEARREQVARLTELGYNQRRIAAELHLSRTTVSEDQRWLRERGP